VPKEPKVGIKGSFVPFGTGTAGVLIHRAAGLSVLLPDGATRDYRAYSLENSNTTQRATQFQPLLPVACSIWRLILWRNQ